MKWFGYLHIEGKLVLKRYFDKKDIESAMESEFVLNVYGPFEAPTRVLAWNELVNLTREKK